MLSPRLQVVSILPKPRMFMRGSARFRNNFLALPLVEPLENRRLLSSAALNFAPHAGGLAGSGFTQVLASAGGSFVAADVNVRHHTLRLTSTAGDLTQGNQDNALGVNLDGAQNFVVQARLATLPFRKAYQSAGIFIGPDQNNYVKFVAGDFGQKGLQLGSEAGGVFTASPVGQLNFASIATLDLRLVGDASTHTLTAQYRINSSSDSAWITFGASDQRGRF